MASFKESVSPWASSTPQRPAPNKPKQIIEVSPLCASKFRTPLRPLEENKNLNKLLCQSEVKPRLNFEDASFELNQSFPRRRRKGPGGRHCFPEGSMKLPREYLMSSMANELNSFSFNSTRGVASLNSSGRKSFLGGRDDRSVINTVMNPNKAVLCLDKDGKILTVNDIACQLLNYSETKLLSLDFEDLIWKENDLEAVSELEFMKPSKCIIIGGRLVEVQIGSGEVITMSLWLKDLPGQKKLAVLENVTKTMCSIKISEKGLIEDMDQTAQLLFQKDIVTIQGKSIATVLPTFNLLDLFRLQNEIGKTTHLLRKLSGRAPDGSVFPVAVRIERENLSSDILLLSLCVYHNLSGLILFESSGLISAYNSHFCSLFFGYGNQELDGEHITKLFPYFQEELEFTESESGDALGCSVLPRTPEEKLEDLVKPFQDRLTVDNSKDKENAHPDNPKTRPYGNDEKRFSEGTFFGLAKHKDGSEISVFYQLKRLDLEDGTEIYCLWISKDLESYTHEESSISCSWIEKKSFHDHADVSLGQLIGEVAEKVPSYPNTVRAQENETFDGEYLNHYAPLQLIGSGGYGQVRLSYRLKDKLLVVTKLILKEKIHPDYWIEDAYENKIPMEVCLLNSLSHPNIIQLLDVFENDKYFQIVMEKHGCIDLFEFIDRRPQMDEALVCHIFRQVVSAIDYLHSLNILHRDIKDENVIIDQNFSIKLVDFGSATYFRPGRLFHTFHGTIEYCSPEVLLGTPYEGPELEIWSLGILFYILLFLENPFQNVDEIIRCQLHLPSSEITYNCRELLLWILSDEPKKRPTLTEIKEHTWLTQQVDLSKYRFREVVHCSREEANPVHFYLSNSFFDETSFSNYESYGRQVDISARNYVSSSNESLIV